jgi:hypothetical protein
MSAVAQFFDRLAGSAWHVEPISRDSKEIYK